VGKSVVAEASKADSGSTISIERHVPIINPTPRYGEKFPWRVNHPLGG